MSKHTFRCRKAEKNWYTGGVDTPILGYRVLDCKDGVFLSPVQSIYAWKDGVNRARCLMHDHTAPSQECTCGIYGFHELNAAVNSLFAHGGAVIVSVIGWGKVCVHVDCWRAENVEVVAILDLGGDETYKKLASKYFGAPLHKEKQFMSHSKEFGDIHFKNNKQPKLLPRIPWQRNKRFLHEMLKESDEVISSLECELIKKSEPIIRKEKMTKFQDFVFRMGFKVIAPEDVRLALRYLYKMQDLLLHGVLGRHPSLSPKERRIVLLHNGGEGRRLDIEEVSYKLLMPPMKVTQVILAWEEIAEFVTVEEKFLYVPRKPFQIFNKPYSDEA